MVKTALICDKCGSKIKFAGMISTCEACGTQYAMVADENDLLQPISYRPMPGKGKMVVPLSIAIANLLKNQTDFIVTDRDYVHESHLYFDDNGLTRMYEETVDADDILYIGIGNIRTEVKVVTKPRSWWQSLMEAPVIHNEKPDYANMMELEVHGVEVKGQIIGETVTINVYGPQYQPQADLICDMIFKNFGILVDCRLMNG